MQLNVKFDDYGYRKTMYFNRFKIQREERFRVVHFGLDLTSEGLLDHYSCVLMNESVEQNQASLLTYLNNTNRPTQKNQPWNKVIPPGPVEIVDVVSMSSKGQMAETVLSFFSMIAANRAAIENKDSFEGRHQVLLRSTRELQSQLIVALYEE